MRKRSIILGRLGRSAGLSLWLCLWSLAAWAQPTPEADNRVEIVHADQLVFKEFQGQRIQKLIGKVHLRQDTTEMYCDSAYRYVDRNFIEAFGDVLIDMKGNRTIRSRKLTYDGETKIIELFRRVVMTDSAVTLTTEHLRYYRKESYGYYDVGGKIVSSENTLTSQFGYYYPDEDMSLFKRQVRLVNPDYILETDTMAYNTRTKTAFFEAPTLVFDSLHTLYTEDGWYDTRNDIANLHHKPWVKDTSYTLYADSIYYDRTIDFGQAYRNIRVISSDSGLSIFGQYGQFRSGPEESVVTDSAYALQHFEADTLYLFADTLYSIEDSLLDQRIFRAWNDAHFYMSQLQGRCDSLVYLYEDSIFYMLQDPMLWSGQSQISGDTIMLGMKNDQADTMSIVNSGFLITQEGDIGYNQVKGIHIRAKFRDNDIHRMWVKGNSESVYYAKDDEKNEIVGVNEARCKDMFFEFEEGKPQRIHFYDQPSGSFRPLYEVYFDKLRLEGFEWKPENRPEKPLWIYYPDSAAYLDSLALALLMQDSVARDSLLALDSMRVDSLDSLATDSLGADSLGSAKGSAKGEVKGQEKKKFFLWRFFDWLFGRKDAKPEEAPAAEPEPPAPSGKGKVKE